MLQTKLAMPMPQICGNLLYRFICKI